MSDPEIKEPKASSPPPAGNGGSDTIQIPTVLGAMLLNDVLIFPNTIVPLVVSADPMIKLVNDALSGSKIVAAFARSSDPASEQPSDQFHEVGTASQILKMFRVPDGSMRLLVQGLTRIRRTRIVETDPYLRVQVQPLPMDRRRSLKVEALDRKIKADFTKLAESGSGISEEVKIAVFNISDSGSLADIVASNLNLTLEQKQSVLEASELDERLTLVGTLLARELKIVTLGSEIQTKVDNEMADNQREYYLREQMRQIRKELGEDNEGAQELTDLEQKIKQAGMTPAAAEVAAKELDRLKRMTPASAEYTVSRTYLEWLAALPWQKSTEDELDIDRAKRILDRDHYGLEDVKNRIIEFLVVRKLRHTGKGPILCFAGPPGVGKTSLGKSISVALNREFIRMSLGGVRDEAEIRGHRRTYIGALPGRVMQSIRRVAVNNPVIMLDEIDKLGNDFRGDPASALLEVLDPAQNSSFQDHYLDVEFDLSRAFFITTANDISMIPPPLRDRMEIIEIPSYVTPEKIKIASHYLVPRQIEENGLKKQHVTFTPSGLAEIVDSYTREAGVRRLEQQIGAVCRKVARGVVSGKRPRITITAKNVANYLGPQQFLDDELMTRPRVGVAVGLAWTPVGGDVLIIESTWMPGAKQLQVTGRLGDVMKESAQIALSYLRANAEQYGFSNDTLASRDIHIHVPEGATPKEGPSAGITIATSLASLFTGRPVDNRVGMTGEITLSGNVLPIGGLREKIVAAHRHGLRRVIIPRLNEKDLYYVPAHIKRAMKFHFVDTVDEVLNVALLKSPAPTSRRTKSRAHA
ncbi:endopeptidase La [candidate division KSB1 bacterium]|nr:endopeptidase La [candidate division KSB1 bacterium]